MTALEISLVKKSWLLLKDIEPAVLGESFYAKLFTDQPGLRRMFPADMSLQYQKLIDMLNSIVEHLHKQEVIRPAIIAMGKRHMIYGVKPFHFRMVAAAFLWMLQQQLAIDYTKEVKQAWTNCYNEVADIMIKANGQ